MAHRRKWSTDPARQGSLDGLCGVYAIINSIHYALGSRVFLQSDAECLYRFMLEQVDVEGWLGDLILRGSSAAELGLLLHLANDWLRSKKQIGVSYSKPFHRDKNALLPQVFDEISRHLRLTRTAVIVGIDGVNGGHWTVARAVTDKNLVLADSGGWRRLSKLQTTAKFNRVGQTHPVYIAPTAVFLIHIRT